MSISISIYHLHFTDESTGAQRGTVQGHMAGKQQGLHSNPGLPLYRILNHCFFSFIVPFPALVLGGKR